MPGLTELCLYGDIGEDWWSGDGITEVHVLDGLKALDKDVDQHTIRINSPGGRVDTGLAIMNLLRSHAAQMKVINPAFKLETCNDGYAMSIASVIMMAGDVRTTCLGSITMIHDAWSGVYGNAGEMRKAAERLDMLSDNCADVYSKTCTPAGKDAPARNAEYFRTLMKAETYMVGDQAINCGLATQSDSTKTAQMHTELTPEKLQGRYVTMMTEHYKRRTFNRPKGSAALSITNAKAAQSRLALLLATMP